MTTWIRNFMVAAGMLAAVTIGAWPSFAYDVIAVQHGGTVEGAITLNGAVPEPKGFNLITFPDPACCGRISNGRGWRLLRDFVVNQHGGLKDTLVLLEGVDAGKPLSCPSP